MAVSESHLSRPVEIGIVFMRMVFLGVLSHASALFSPVWCAWDAFPRYRWDGWTYRWGGKAWVIVVVVVAMRAEAIIALYFFFVYCEHVDCVTKQTGS